MSVRERYEFEMSNRMILEDKLLRINQENNSFKNMTVKLEEKLEHLKIVQEERER